MYKIVAKFRDENMPDWNTTAESEQAAINEAAHIQNMLAGLRSICIISPEGAKLVYNGAGVYMFTIPAFI